jgi:pSer/pThr/pTyr-binding forkhead associated (FHA) protein
LGAPQESEEGRTDTPDIRGTPGDPAHLIVFRQEGRSRAVRLDPAEGALTVGRGTDCGLSVWWDERVSRRHASIEHRDGRWYVVDDEVSLNGTFVNLDRVRGERALEDRDVVRVGRTTLVFRDHERRDARTVASAAPPASSGRATRG